MAKPNFSYPDSDYFVLQSYFKAAGFSLSFFMRQCLNWALFNLENGRKVADLINYLLKEVDIK